MAQWLTFEEAAAELNMLPDDLRRIATVEGISTYRHKAWGERRVSLHGLRAYLARRPSLMNRMERLGGVYFIQATSGGPVKIGWSIHPRKRLADLQVGNPEPLVLLCFIPGANEQMIQAEFADLRLGGEWFRPEPHLFSRMLEMAS